MIMNSGLLNQSFIGSRKFYSSVSTILRENFVPFDLMVQGRRNEAKKSVVVQVPSWDDSCSVQTTCSAFGNISNMFEFQPSGEKFMYMIEFDDESSVEGLINRAYMGSRKNRSGLVTQVPFLTFVRGKMQRQTSHLESNQTTEVVPLSKHLPQEALIIKHIKKNCRNMSEQIQYFFDQQKMTEIGWRLRFHTCRKFEWILPRVLRGSSVLPFGSSVSTFGNRRSDLDMVIDFDAQDPSIMEDDRRFVFALESWSREKHLPRRTMERQLHVVADILSLFVPSFSQVLRILHANVPIIKCRDKATGLDCDVTVDNKSGYHMSALLYLYGCSDVRVRPLVFAVRWWANWRELNRPEQPGRWFSNFTMSLLVIFFLMNGKSSPPVLSPLNTLNAFAAEKSESSSQSVSLSSLGSCPLFPASANEQSLEDLLVSFFHFYANFDYKKHGLSLFTGKLISKPNYSALYIENPIERHLNVSRNLNYEEVETFQSECRLALSYFDGTDVQSIPSDLLDLLTFNKLGRKNVNSFAYTNHSRNNNLSQLITLKSGPNSTSHHKRSSNTKKKRSR